MAAYATAADLEARWRALTEAEESLAEALLEDASGEIDAEFRRLGRVVADELVAGNVTADDLKVVACRVVKRAMASPLGDDGAAIETMQFSAGPFQESRKYANPTGDLYLTKADRRRLGIGGPVASSVPMFVVDEESSS